jgi:hypothetical protein
VTGKGDSIAGRGWGSIVWNVFELFMNDGGRVVVRFVYRHQKHAIISACQWLSKLTNLGFAHKPGAGHSGQLVFVFPTVPREARWIGPRVPGTRFASTSVNTQSDCGFMPHRFALAETSRVVGSSLTFGDAISQESLNGLIRELSAVSCPIPALIENPLNRLFPFELKKEFVDELSYGCFCCILDKLFL